MSSMGTRYLHFGGDWEYEPVEQGMTLGPDMRPMVKRDAHPADDDAD
jgi:hypothetical protein